MLNPLTSQDGSHLPNALQRILHNVKSIHSYSSYVGQHHAPTFKKENHAQRAVLSPPRLPALCAAFNADAYPHWILANTGGAQPKRAAQTNAKPCT